MAPRASRQGVARHCMGPETDHSRRRLPFTVVVGRTLAGAVATLGIGFFVAAVGFVGFLSQLRGAEIKPERKADGIVVLTGGSSRGADAGGLLAGGYGRGGPGSRRPSPHEGQRSN